MRILFWGTYDTGKPRTRILLKGLQLTGVNVDECHVEIWRGVEDKSQVHSVGRRFGIGLRWLLSYPHLAWRLARAPRPDVILVGFPGFLDMLVAAPIARWRGIPLVWDMFMSLYDTVVEDRKLLCPGGLPARILYWLEKFALRRADLVFLDTRAHARRIEQLFNLGQGSIGAVWVGAETEHFHAISAGVKNAGRQFRDLRVLFYGQFIPLHGIETIIHAARLTRDEPVEWQLIGRGQEANRIKTLLAEQPLPKVRWDSWVDYGQLPQHIATVDVCLGIFGTSDKAASVIPNKVFQIVAMGRPLITRDSPAIREMLDDAPPCIRLIPPADPTALAAAVLEFSRRRYPVLSCHAALRGRVGAEAIGRQCLSLLISRLGLES